MITKYFRSVKESRLEKVDEVRPGTWVHVEQPTDTELDVLAKDLALERHLLTDAVDFYEVPRFESEAGVAYFFTRFPHRTDEDAETAPILLAITPTAVVSVSREHPSFVDTYLEGNAPLFTTQRTKLFLFLISAINTAYQQRITTIRREVQRGKVNLRKIRENDVVHLVALESSLNEFISALGSSSAALRTILSGNHLQLYEEDRDMIEDIQLENQQLLESAKASLKTIQNIRSAYTVIITNNLNQVIKLLTSITVILTIPTIVASLGGMNVPIPFQTSPHAFTFVIGIIVITMGAVWYVFSRQEWL
jgi:magnesium transporter